MVTHASYIRAERQLMSNYFDFEKGNLFPLFANDSDLKTDQK